MPLDSRVILGNDLMTRTVRRDLECCKKTFPIRVYLIEREIYWGKQKRTKTPQQK